MRFRELIPEMARAPLYHGTTLAYLVLILDSDQLIGQIRGVSLTRSLAYAQKWAAMQSRHNDLSNWFHDEKLMRRLFQAEDAVGSPGAVLVFDQDKLRQVYGRKLEPFADEGWYGDDHPRREAEETLYVNSLKPVSQFLIDVKVDPDVFSRYLKLLPRSEFKKKALRAAERYDLTLGPIKESAMTKRYKVIWRDRTTNPPTEGGLQFDARNEKEARKLATAQLKSMFFVPVPRIAYVVEIEDTTPLT